MSAFQDALAQAVEQRIPIPAFNLFDLASIRGAIRASEQAGRPIIAQFSQRTVAHYGADACVAGVRTATRECGGRAFIHLDHCSNPAILSAALAAGFDGIMVDASNLPLEENIRISRDWVARASAIGALVEAEVTPIQGVEDGAAEGMPTTIDVDLAARYVEGTAVRLFGADIGTRHGLYATPPRIDFDLVSKLAALRAGFVIHGGSGLDASTLERLARCGIAKINFSTDLKLSWLSASKRELEHESGEPLALLKACESSVHSYCLGILEYFR